MSDKPVRVLSVCTSDSSGGAARAAYRIHRAVQDLGVDSRMFVKQKGTDDPTVLTVDDFIPHHALYRGFDWARNKVKNKWEHYVWGKYPAREKYFMSDLRSTDIGGALRKIDYDVLHLHWINLRFLPLEQLPKDKPIVWTLHDSWPFCGICHIPHDCMKYKAECGNCPYLHSSKFNDISHQVWKKKNDIYHKLNLHIITPSLWLGSCARESRLLSKFPLEVIPNGLDTEIFRPLNDNELTTQILLQKKQFEGKHILVFGAMQALRDPNKGYDKLKESLSILSHWGVGKNLALLVFGTDDFLTDIPSEISTSNLGVIRNAKELVSLYSIASVVVVPSYSEVFGQVASEALACGTPVVAFRCTGIQEVIQDNCGYLAVPFNAEDFARGILWCINNNDSDRLSSRAREHALKSFSLDTVADRYCRYYHSIL